MAQKIGAALLAHADKIWDTADTLRGAGIKEGDFPSYMMPFFALMLVESRLRRFKDEKIAEFSVVVGQPFDAEDAEHREWLEKSALAAHKGYHPELLLHGKGLHETCLVPGGNFRNRLLAHLDLYDRETKRLLGLRYVEGDAKFLDIQGKASDLFARPNSPLYAFAKKWAAVDLTRFSNSEVTTIEEHIKRKWGDISAETAGEQYTPADVIEMATALIVELRRESCPSDGIADLYDMTCGGGNFLFATEDALRDAFPKLSVRTRGQEHNEALYALAAIEARFRADAVIQFDNTLTNDRFLSDKFDVIVANPPYGIDWKDARAAVEADASGRFAKDRLPPVTDGQLLFLQHAAFHLSESGVGAVVLNGSAMFSGDAGSGESQTRHWMLKERDLVEAIVQMPKGEFFNTDISTYLWVLNRSKPAARRGRVLLINAESCFVKLKRNLNKKNCEIDQAGRDQIVEAFKAFSDGPMSRVLALDDLLYNKVEIAVRRLDSEGRSIEQSQRIEGGAIELLIDGLEFSIEDGRLDAGQFEGMDVKEAAAEFNAIVKQAERIEAAAGGVLWEADSDSGRVTMASGSSVTELGLGRLVPKARAAKARGVLVLKVDVSLEPLIEKQIETVPFVDDKELNQIRVQEHLAKWVSEPGAIVKMTTGCSINFNRIFPKLSGGRSIREVLVDMKGLNAKMAQLEAEFQSSLEGL